MDVIGTTKVDCSSEFDSLGAYINYCKQQLTPKSNKTEALELLDIGTLNEKIDNNVFDREILEDFDHLLNVVHNDCVTLVGNARPLYSRLYLARRVIDKLYLNFESLTNDFRQKEIQLTRQIEVLKLRNATLSDQLSAIVNKNETNFIALNREKDAFMKELEALDKEKEEFANNKAELEQKMKEWCYSCNITDSYIDSLIKRILVNGNSNDAAAVNECLYVNDKNAVTQENICNINKRLQIVDLLRSMQSPQTKHTTAVPPQITPQQVMMPQQVCYPWPIMPMPVCCCKKKEEECCNH